MRVFFIYPFYLYLLFLIPLIVFIHFASLKLRRSHALKFANFNAIARIKGIDIYSKGLSLIIISILIVCSIVFSLAGTTIEVEGSSSAFSFVIAVDSSRSMEASDILPTRFEAAKKEASNFVSFLPDGTRIGIISFSGNSYIYQKVTGDKSLVKSAINSLDFSPIGGTDIYDAVVTSANLLEGYEKKAIVLLSDGQINVGSINEMIDYANKNSLVIHTIAMGTKEGGGTSYGLSKLDEESIKALAFNTKGVFSSATNQAELANSFKSIADIKTGKVTKNISNYLQMLSLILLVILYALINTRFRAFP